jgi:membrane peptidoglycan carboxypeptidase
MSSSGSRSRTAWRRARLARPAFVSLVALLLLAGWELQTSTLQASYFSGLARTLDFRVEAGASPAIRFPSSGPFDERLGYTRITAYAERLRSHGYRVAAQARQSPALLDYTERGFFPPYAEKVQAGLQLLDCRNAQVFEARYPQRIYSGPEAIPPLVMETLAFIENRELLADNGPNDNPALELPRLAKAVADQAVARVEPGHPAAGGSTLATQIEKYRHSPAGRTASVHDKYRQMFSASVRAYRDGMETLQARERIISDYINTLPLGAHPGYGEVNGVGDGLWVWYGADFDAANRALQRTHPDGDALRAQARAYRQVLGLLIAQRRPSFYFGSGRSQLARLIDSYLRVLADAGIITPALRDAALLARPALRDDALRLAGDDFSERKAASLLRVELASLLDTPRLYDLNRLDLEVTSSIDGALQAAITSELRRLRVPANARAAGMVGPHLLERGDPSKLFYSFTLVERGADGNRLRVQTDNLDQPFDINAGAKLELGSTAKLRTLVTYLEIVAALHQRHAALAPAELRKIEVDHHDHLSRWAIDYLLGTTDRRLPAMLAAAMERRYSANPGEVFFTGGGAHTFENFEPEDNHRNPSVREALQDSINLAFIRLMRDVVQHLMYSGPDAAGPVLADVKHPRRALLLARFAEREGSAYVRHFYRKYRALSPDEWQQLPPRLHPLERAVATQLRQHPNATLPQVLAASAAARRDAYTWLFQPRMRAAQDTRIATLLEADAFAKIHRSWQRLGYPFEYLVPSYATAIGSSGDRPAALAELMGIIVNDGLRAPTLRIESLRFAAGTPYETVLQRDPAPAERVLAPEIATTLRGALLQVVEKGTARRVNAAFDVLGSRHVAIGGKTGTGDNRATTVDAHGKVIESRVLSRTATFVFFIGERHFGTVTAYVPGAAAADYRFTSALPVQILKTLAPLLRPITNSGAAACVHDADAPATSARARVPSPAATPAPWFDVDEPVEWLSLQPRS